MADRRRQHPALGLLAGTAVVCAILAAVGAGTVEARQSRAVLEMQQRAREQLARDRIERFSEDAFAFFEISGELVSFRVHPNMTASEVALLDDRAEELEDHVDGMLDYLRGAVPFVRGETEGLWIIHDPPDESTTLDERLTLILALANRLSPKLDQLVTLLRGDVDLTVTVDSLQFEASAPYFVVGGLEEMLSLTRDLRRAL
jgi:hypothetical protein